MEISAGEKKEKTALFLTGFKKQRAESCQDAAHSGLRFVWNMTFHTGSLTATANYTNINTHSVANATSTAIIARRYFISLLLSFL